MVPWLLLTLIATAVLVVAEVREKTAWRMTAKPLASSGFLLLANAAGALSCRHGRLMFLALALCFVGDMLLLSDSKRVFAAGLGSFLAAHVTFATAFWIRGVDRPSLAGGLAVGVPVAILVLRWLAPHVRGPMRGAVTAYVVTIVAMFATAAGTTGAHGDWRIVSGALIFLVSDLAVARHRFVRREAVNRLVGLPLYYVAQLLLASSAGPR